MQANRNDHQNDIHCMDTNYYRAKDAGMTVAQYVTARIETVHRRYMAVGRDKGRPVHEMTAVIY